MRSATDYTNRCEGCLLRRDLCLCAEVPSLANRTRVVVVRHQLEAFRSTNTARIALLALQGASLLEYGTEDVAARLPRLLGPDPVLLFPDGVAPWQGDPVVRPPSALVMVDGSWSQARRMVQRITPLRALPRLELPSLPPLPRLRVAPRADGLSTIEALVRALELLEGEAVAAPLAELARLHAARSRAARGTAPDASPACP